jgi:protein SCO1
MPKRLFWSLLSVAFLALGILGAAMVLKNSEVDKPSRLLASYGKIPDFSLTNQAGEQITRASFDGKYWVVDLIFTTCQGTCPMMSQQMLALQRSLVKTPDVKLVSISVDPTKDTPEALQRYAKFYGADTQQWSFLTGPVNTIYTVAKDGFHLPVDSVGGDNDNPIVHSERFVLVDKKGEIRGYYNGTEADAPQRVLMDIGELMRQEAR